ncbi:GNAT family N-acetyltransferase [Devosia sp.]|uniref:GNAT family N-acetyltransferase n=1 Tax=Devosia sp. TaxID=1871048 RepID=UPI003BA9A8C7
MRIERLVTLPAQMDTLRAEARSEGFRHIEDLWQQWQDQKVRFDRPGEILVCAYAGDELAAVGGITEDFIDPAWLRMRRFYVRPQFRRQGVGKAIVDHLLPTALPLGRPIALYTDTPQGAAFWEAQGFVPIAREKTTHALPERGRPLR